MFEAFSRSWAYAKTSYGILWGHKRLLIFPVLSGLAAIIVTLSFFWPAYGSGALERWLEGGGEGADRTGMYVTAFFFYFCNYLVIVFFNSALIASVMMWSAGGTPTIGGGLSVACKRMPQIFGWALISAVVGVLLKVVENSNKKAGRFIAGILGMGWTALTYFVVPIIVVDGVGPFQAFKRSTQTLRSTWGTALMGNFSLGLIGLLVSLPLFLLAGLVVYAGFAIGSAPAIAAAIVVGLIVIVTSMAASSAAGTVFRALLFSYSTDRVLPAGVDSSQFADAFVPSGA